MSINFPDSSVSNNVSFILDFVGMLPPDRNVNADDYRPDLLLFNDKTKNTEISIGANGSGFMQASLTGSLYTGGLNSGLNTGGYLTTTFSEELVFGLEPYTIEIILERVSQSRLDRATNELMQEGLLSVAENSSPTNWELRLDAALRPAFYHGTTVENPSINISDKADQPIHIVVTRSNPGLDGARIYVDGQLARTFSDPTNYSYSTGINIGSGRTDSPQTGLTDAYISAVRIIKGESKYTGVSFAPLLSFDYVAVGDTFRYENVYYYWDGIKWVPKSKINSNVVSENPNYSFTEAISSDTVLDLDLNNYFGVQLYSQQDTAINFINEASEHGFLIEFIPEGLDDNGNLEDGDYIEYRDAELLEANIRDMQFRPDGTYMYTLGTSRDRIEEYILFTPWDISTAWFTGREFIIPNEAAPYSLYMSPNGDRFIYAGGSGTVISQYDITNSDWDITTTQDFVSVNKPTGTDDYWGITISPDRTGFMYLNNFSQNRIEEWTLPTPGSISGSTYNGNNFDYSDITTSGRGLHITDDGSTIYIADETNDRILQFGLTTNWVFSTAELTQVLDVSSQTGVPNGIAFKPDMSKLYVSGSSADIYQYNTTGKVPAPTVTWPNNILWSTGSAPIMNKDRSTFIELYKYNRLWHGNVINGNQ